MSKVDLKVVLLGKEFGGKTSLVDRFINKRFVESKSNSYQATIGAAFASKKIQIDSKVITLGIWDTAGSERYEAMSRMYYRNARAAIICFDLTDDSSFSRAKFWVSELKKNEEMCRIYLCGTKCDRIKSDPQLRRIDAQTAINYANAIGATFTETSSKTGEGVEELFTKIAKDYIEFQMILEGPKNQNYGLSFDNSLHSSDDRKKSFCCF